MSEATPGFNHQIPAEIMTPDSVETRIGRLEFFDGFPTAATTGTVYDNLDFLRGVEVFLNFVPMASLEGLRRGLTGFGVTSPNKVVIFDELMDSNPLFLTGNTDTVYALTLFDLAADGPTVVEVPPRCGPGTVNDAFFRFVIDMGGPGPDRGQGGKYLIVPTDYDGEIPEATSSAGHRARSTCWCCAACWSTANRMSRPRTSPKGSGSTRCPRPPRHRRWNSSAGPARRSTPCTPTTSPSTPRSPKSSNVNLSTCSTRNCAGSRPVSASARTGPSHPTRGCRRSWTTQPR